MKLRRHEISAFCGRDGVIEFGRQVPEGLLPIMRGRSREVRAIVEVCARHAYDGRTLLVPGLPEAENDEAALDALMRFRDYVRLRGARAA